MGTPEKTLDPQNPRTSKPSTLKTLDPQNPRPSKPSTLKTLNPQTLTPTYSYLLIQTYLGWSSKG